MLKASLRAKYGDLSPHIHQPLCDFFQDRSFKRRSIYEPRNFLKSTLFTCWGSIWRYLHNNDIRILIASQNQEIAKRFIRYIKSNVAHHELLRKVYPELQRIDRSWVSGRRDARWSSECADFPRSIDYKESTITSIGVAGAAQSGHYDIVHIDDPVGEKQMNSKVELEKVLSWFDGINELLDNPFWDQPNGSEVNLACTFWGPGDFGCYVQQNYPEYQWRIVPALKFDDTKDTQNVKYIQDPTVGIQQSNWEGAPDGRSKTEYYLEMMANPEKEQRFWSQHMNMPRAGGALNKFLFEWLRYYHIEKRDNGEWIVCDDDKEEFKIGTMRLFGFIDPGGFAETKLVKGGSRNAVVVGGQPEGSVKKFILYTFAEKFKKPSDFRDVIFAAHERFRPRLWRIDAAATQAYIMRDVKETAVKEGISFPLMEIPADNRKDSKDGDIQGLIPVAASGELYVQRDMKAFIGEYINYPGGLTRDLIDMAGKLNTHNFSRKPRFFTTQQERVLEDSVGRSTRTGY